MSTRPQQECRTGFVWKHTARIRLISAIRHHEVRANCNRENGHLAGSRLRSLLE
jgi:hypothetical protein